MNILRIWKQFAKIEFIGILFFKNSTFTYTTIHIEEEEEKGINKLMVEAGDNKVTVGKNRMMELPVCPLPPDMCAHVRIQT